MAIFNSYIKLPEGNQRVDHNSWQNEMVCFESAAGYGIGSDPKLPQTHIGS